MIKKKLNADQLESLKVLKDEKKKMVFSLCFLMRQMICVCCENTQDKEKVILYEEGLKILKEKTDIVSFMKINDDLNEMKLILFNKFQAMCFNFIRRPSLVDNDDYSKLFKCIKDDEFKQKLYIIDYFSKKIKNPRISKFDRKFFAFLEDDIREIVKKINN